MNDNQRKLKEGHILHYKSGFLSKKWKDSWVVLFSDSEFVWYDKKNDSKPVGSVFLKDVVPYTCVGPVCDRMPVRRPDLPSRYSLHHLVGIGMDSRASKVHWFLFASDSDLESWFTEIMKTLPMPVPPVAGTQQPVAPGGINPSVPIYNPPSIYPNAPSSPAQTYPSQPYNPAQQPSPVPPQYAGSIPAYGATGLSHGGGGTTVIVNDRGGRDYGPTYVSDSSRRRGLGLGSGMLMGSLMGFGLGSMWGGGLHHSPFGLGCHGFSSPLGMGSGFGGGYIQFPLNGI
ncbi:unnamed protein product [Thelazia callipaeda]|uniref:PH domain-containing protein n=1 Tax=Thelazia callipaeda TaxID=103827 RepID=A0A0N5D7H5_THECL|nr:unnamed protein product [Thelazia callipaeda]